MKISTLLQGFILIGILLMNENCRKDDPTSNINTPQSGQGNTAPPVSVNTAPVVKAGQDILVFLPDNSCQLNGSVTDKENNISTIHWRSISGTLSQLIEKPDSLETTVRNLEKGDYQFELTVTDSGGLTGKDTCNVNVHEFTSTVIFLNQTWIFPWYNAIEIKNFNTLLTQNALFKVYIKRDASPDWIEVPSIQDYVNESYDYFVESRPDGAGIYHYGSLYINYFGTDVSDTPDVKIEFY
jgi:hypothetical protein